MRRKERQVTDKKRLEQIIEACHCIRVGFFSEGQVYIVPVNFGYVFEDEKYTFYFHSAKEGRKMELIKSNPTVGFEMDTGYELKMAASACGHTAYFQSIVGQGKEFQEKMLDAVCVWKLEVIKLTGKENI